jgi:elongation factor 1-beta
MQAVPGSERELLLLRVRLQRAIKDNGEMNMGEVAITYRIMPVNAEVNLTELSEQVAKTSRSVAKLQGMQEKPIAFGISAILIRVVIEDKEGGPDEIETALSSIEGVQSVEVMDLTRL